MAADVFLTYLVTVVGLSMTPGPNSLLVLTHGALYGHRSATFTVIGGVAGFVSMMALSMLGIGALLQARPEALEVLCWVGGAYLVWLALQLWRAPPLDLTPGQGGQAPGVGALLGQGLLTAVSNPKVLLFYGAFLPQFIDPERPLLLQFAVLAGTLCACELLVQGVLARMSHRLRPVLQRAGRLFNRACGTLFLLVGVAMPLAR